MRSADVVDASLDALALTCLVADGELDSAQQLAAQVGQAKLAVGFSVVVATMAGKIEQLGGPEGRVLIDGLMADAIEARRQLTA